MDYLIICFVALVASILTFFSGFGLGTILLPAFALFFPVEAAVAMTGVVHLANNLFKMALVGRNAVWRVVLKFGLPAIIGAVAGAWILMYFSDSEELFSYSLLGAEFSVYPVSLTIGLLMLLFAIVEILPAYNNLQFSEDKLILGGTLSGFFGGLSGHQGALRSAFLIKVGLSKEGFIATGVIIASVVDISRLSVYFSNYNLALIEDRSTLIIAAVFSAFIGAFLGKRMLKKVTIGFVQVLVSIMIMFLGVLIGAGII